MRGLLWKDTILPFVAFQEQRGGGEGWDERQRQKGRQKEKEGEWAARAEIGRLLASRAERLVLLAPLWLADLGLDRSGMEEFLSRSFIRIDFTLNLEAS